MLFILGILAIWFIGLSSATRKLLEQTKKTHMMLARSTQNPSEIVGRGLGDIGIEGIMNEFGIDAGILNNPLVKGLISKYAPKIIEQISKTNKGAPPPVYGPGDSL